MLYEMKVLVTITTPEPITQDAAEVETLELLEAMTESSHPFNAASVHVIALEKVE